MEKNKRFYHKIIHFLKQITGRKLTQVADAFNDYKLGNQFLTNNLFEEAQAAFQRHVEKFPHRPQGYEGLSTVALKTWERDVALKWLNISIEKTKAKSSYKRKARLLVNHGQFEEGFETVASLIEKHGQELSTLIFKSDLLLIAGRYAQAVDILRPLYEQNKNHTDIQKLLAQSLIGNRQMEEASKVIEQMDFLEPSKDPQGIVRLLKAWQQHHQTGISKDTPHIFGIGLSRTGTTTLTKALTMLGYSAIHFINPITKKIIDLDDLYYFDAFSDSPISFRFEELYDLFPNAQFIYTVRNLEDWIRSSENLYKPRGFSTTVEMKKWLETPPSASGKFDKLYHNFNSIYQKAYGSLYADFPNWESAYHAFDKRVNDFFKNKPANKLLKINICDGEGWEKLCPFLNKAEPIQAFPYAEQTWFSEAPKKS